MGLFWTRTDLRASTPSETQALSRHQSTYAFEIGRRNTDVSQARKSSAVPGGAMWPCGEGRELWDTEELREVGRRGVEDNRLPFPQCSVRESRGSQECRLQLCPVGRQLRPAPIPPLSAMPTPGNWESPPQTAARPVAEMETTGYFCSRRS